MTWDDRYEREWTDDVEVGETQIRYGLTTDSGLPVKFLVQLEYHPQSDADNKFDSRDWLAVARFDHDAAGPPYRNVERVGLHMDVLKPNGTQLPKRRDFPPIPLNQAMRYADDYLRYHHDFLIGRFVEWL